MITGEMVINDIPPNHLFSTFCKGKLIPVNGGCNFGNYLLFKRVMCNTYSPAQLARFSNNVFNTEILTVLTTHSVKPPFYLNVQVKRYRRALTISSEEAVAISSENYKCVLCNDVYSL